MRPNRLRIHGRPLISCDDALDEKHALKEAVAELRKLAGLNKTRPRFLLLHDRQWSHIKRVKRIFDRLGSKCEVVRLDLFMDLAGSNPTFAARHGNSPRLAENALRALSTPSGSRPKGF